jgi:hypothetical protein
MSVRNYHSTLCNIAEEHTAHPFLFFVQLQTLWLLTSHFLLLNSDIPSYLTLNCQVRYDKFQNKYHDSMCYKKIKNMITAFQSHFTLFAFLSLEYRSKTLKLQGS